MNAFYWRAQLACRPIEIKESPRACAGHKLLRYNDKVVQWDTSLTRSMEKKDFSLHLSPVTVQVRFPVPGKIFQPALLNVFQVGNIRFNVRFIYLF
jgi:hypothetical protein